MVVLNVALLGIAGCVGLGFLLQVLRRLNAPSLPAPQPPPIPSTAPPPATGAGIVITRQNRKSEGLFAIWLVIYALVGMQMGWLLRPFIGHPAAEFQWFRARDGSFFQGLFDNLSRLISGS
jgi:hypothetical protein